MKRIYLKLVLLLAFLLSATNASAFSGELTSAPSATFKTEFVEEVDMRHIFLRQYLQSHNSPLSDYSKDFIYFADEYDLDWRMVAAISGVESTFGKRIPPSSYNAYGWANGKYSFDSWEDSIEIVSKTLREKYIDDGLVTVDQISARYAPPSDSWSWKVEFFMNEIERYPLEFTI